MHPGNDDPTTNREDRASSEDIIFKSVIISSNSMIAPTSSLQDAFKTWKKSNDARKVRAKHNALISTRYISMISFED
jgi:hypothetical protein